MHIPDGYLDLKTAAGAGVLAVAGLGYALRHAKKTLPPRKVPLLGLSAAFIFVAQMVNFPVLAGTSGHLVGGVLAAALLGPSAALIVMAAVLIVQCLGFADGGITALGANVFNMGLLGGAVGGMLYGLLARCSEKRAVRIVAAAVAAWCATELAALACTGELVASGRATWGVALPLMLGVHAVIGVGEALITAGVLAAIGSVRPELLAPPAMESRPSKVESLKPVLVFGLLAAVGIALFVSPYASSLPDGLDAAARSLGFEHFAQPQGSLWREYTPVWAAVAAVLLFAGVYGAASLLLGRRRAAVAE